MSAAKKRGAEEARAQLPALLDAAETGETTIITRHGRPIAALVPIKDYDTAAKPQQSLLSLAGSGKGFWGEDSTQTIRQLRDEWER